MGRSTVTGIVVRPLSPSEPIPVPERPIPYPDVVLEPGTDGWALLVNPDTAGPVALNRTGLLVWQLIDGRRSPAEIISAVRARFPDAPDTVGDDVMSLLTRLAEQGFIGQEVPYRRMSDEQ